MTSSNINKIVQSHANLKPWVLAKNTNEIVNTYIQKIYKQMPQQFKKEKLPKMATPREENKGPLRTLKSQAAPAPLTVTPKIIPAAKKPSKLKQQQQQDKHLLNSLKLSNINNVQIASKFAGVNLSTSKRLLKSPNYKIYKTRRFGSSASSSRSSIFRRYEERRRQRQNYPAQINYLIRSFHTNQLEPTYARYLMPARNQQVEAYLGSIPDAIKFSHNIQNDLMQVNSTTRSRLSKKHSSNTVKSSQVFNKRKEQAMPLPMMGKYPISDMKDSPLKSLKKAQEKNLRKVRILPEQREYATVNVQRMAQMKHPKPPNEVFTAQHDRNQTELHEKHRRNRMQKLGLMRATSPAPNEIEFEGNTCSNEQAANNMPKGEELISSAKDVEENFAAPLNSIKTTLTPRNYFKLKEEIVEPPIVKKAPATAEGHELMTVNNNFTKFQALNENNKISSAEGKETKKEPSLATPKTSVPSAANTSNRSSSIPTAIPKAYNIKSAIATVRAQMPNKNNYQAYRYNRADFFSTKKY